MNEVPSSSISPTKKADGTVNLTEQLWDEITKSIIIYPGNSPMSDSQKCRIIFPDGFEHTYTVPIVKIQQYSLEEIASKDLLLFIPFTLLRFAPRVTGSFDNGSGKPHDTLSEKELTDFIGQIIVILKNAVTHGRLTTTQFKDYIRLLQYSAERVFRQAPNHQEEVYRMTKSVLILPSDEMEMALAEKDSDLAKQATVIAEQATALAEKDSALAEKDSIILQLQTEIQYLKKEKA